jgi:tmRNA-binding protein
MHGTITVDLVDARKKELVWRATAKGKMDYDKREKLLEQANKAVAEIFKKYPPPKQ